MGKIESKKQQKKTTLLQASFDLFTQKGFSKTTISDIAKQSGLAKGTFYLYFKDKYDLRDKLVAHKAGQLFAEFHMHLLANPDYDRSTASLEEQIIWVADYIIDRFEKNHTLLLFLSKNLSWGVFQSAFSQEIPQETQQFYQYYLALLERQEMEHPISQEEADMLLFTIIELISSTCDSCILHDQPVSMQTYLPYLRRTIRCIVREYIG